MFFTRSVIIILLLAFFRMGVDPPRSARHAISFCYCWQLLFELIGLDIAIILINMQMP